MVAIGVIALWMSASPPWQPPGKPPGEGDVQRRLRLFFDVEAAHAVGTLHSTTQGVRISHDAVGVFGRHREGVGFGLGWGLSDRWIVGARGDFVVFPDRAPDGASTMSRGGGVNGFAELLFARARGLRPYVMARAGVGAFASFRHDNGEWDSRARRVVVPTVGLGLGAHAFITEDLAFDIAVTVDHRFNLRARRGQSDVGFELRDGKLLAAIAIGFSRWF